MIRSLDNEDKQHINNVGVISLLGDRFHGVSIGATIFGNKGYSADVPDWEIDKYIESSVADALARSTSYNVSIIDKAGTSANRFYTDQQGIMINDDKLYSLPDVTKLDTIILIDRTQYDNQPFLRSPYGFYQRTSSNVAYYQCIYSLFTISVLDTTLRQDTAISWSFPLRGRGACHEPEEGLPVAWKNQFEEYTDAEQELIKSEVLKSIDRSIDHAIEYLGITTQFEPVVDDSATEPKSGRSTRAY